METDDFEEKHYPKRTVRTVLTAFFAIIAAAVVLAFVVWFAISSALSVAVSIASPATVAVADDRGVEGYVMPDKTTQSIQNEDGTTCEPKTYQITGIDARTETDLQQALSGQPTNTRSDAMLNIHVTCTGKAFLFNAMRDTWMDSIDCGNGTDTYAAKLNAAFSRGGVVCQMLMVENIIQQPIDDAIVIDFNGFKHAIDRIGGIEITVEKDTTLGKFTYAAGTHTYMGDATLNNVQNRLSNPTADWGRNANQRDVLLSLIQKMAQLSPAEQLSIASDLQGDVAMTSGFKDVTGLVALFNQFKDVEWSEGYIPTPNSGWVGDQSVVFLDQPLLAEFREDLKNGTLDEYFAQH